MDGLDFPRRYGAERTLSYAPLPPMIGELVPEDVADEDRVVELDYEIDAKSWTAQAIAVPPSWRPQDWSERPRRFVDGKDVGETVTCLYTPNGGHPIPIRLSEIGSIALREVDGAFRREFESVERVVSMIVDPFPWHEVEAFAGALQEHGFRLLPARAPGGVPSFDYEVMRKAAQNRSMDEMGVLEEAAVAQDDDVPTVIDGRLEPRQGGFDQTSSPVIGVIKTLREFYLHARGMQLLYQLQPGQRTPLFALTQSEKKETDGTITKTKRKLPVVSWYLRLFGTPGALPNWGIVRVELPLAWFEKRSGGAAKRDIEYVDQLSRTLCEYRCRDDTYGRFAVSLHPIVRAEQSLSALFSRMAPLASRFWRLIHL